MNAPFVQSLLVIMGLFAAASVVGVMCYWAIMVTRGPLHDLFLLVALTLLAVPTAIAFIGESRIGAYLLGIVAMMSLLPAILERRLDYGQYNWSWYFLRMIVTMCVSVVVGIGILLLVGNAHSLQLDVPDWLPMAAVLGGFALTPPSISLLRWGVRTSKLRPGLDRALNNEESQRLR